MNTLWSKKVQGIYQLDLSRERRFRDDRKDLVLYQLGFKPGMTVVDLGCGPGALTRKFAKWLGPTSKIIGIDRDTNFIAYAKEKAREQGLTNLTYIESDALHLPLEDNSVDACTSHSVIEHVPNREFLLEQKRICRSGGRVSAMAVRSDRQITSDPQELHLSERETELWGMITTVMREAQKEHNIASHDFTYDGLPKLFDELGFLDVQVDALALPVVPDDARNNAEERLAMLEEERVEVLETLELVLGLHQEPVADSIVIELKSLLEERYAKRRDMVEQGISVWNYEIAIVLIVSGLVP